MSFENQLLFFFSALGAFNGLFLSLYFAFVVKNKSRATHFLAALIFVISVRVCKSVFLSFYPQTSSLFIQIGLTACLLIGPFLYLYVKEMMRATPSKGYGWLLHIIPIIVAMIIAGYLYPYRGHEYLWRRSAGGYFGIFLTIQWTTYVAMAIYGARKVIVKFFNKKEKLENKEFWMINVIFGATLIWLAYSTTRYTSYIVGALSFSFTIYLSLLIWIFKRRSLALFFNTPEKYANKKIDESEARLFLGNLDSLLKEKELYKNANLRLTDVASQLNVQPHYLSQFLNDNCGKSFSLFINEYRIEAAKNMVINQTDYTTEAIGYECGFNSKSTFFTTFKKITGTTPSLYRDRQ